MSIARIKTWIAGEVLTASDLNAEINNVLNNAVDLWSPASKAADMNGFEFVLDADGDSSIVADKNDQIDFRVGGVRYGYWSTRGTLVGSNTGSFIGQLGIGTSLSSNALTVSLLTNGGSTPSSSEWVPIAFRDSTATTGRYDTVLRATSATTVTLSAGSTLGFAANQASRIYVLAINNGSSTIELALYHPLTASGLVGLDESWVISTTAEGGAGGADSAGVAYSTTARANVTFRIIGYIEIQTGGTAGNWSNAATRVQVMGPGVHRTGDVVQELSTFVTSGTTGTTVLPNDNTIPQNTEGDQYMSLAITPSNLLNRLIIEVSIYLFHNAASARHLVAALFQDSTADALRAGSVAVTAADLTHQIQLQHSMVAATTSATTFKVRAGCDTAGTTTFNPYSFGSTVSSGIRITEVFT